MAATFVPFVLLTNQYEGVIRSNDRWLHVVCMHAVKWRYDADRAHQALLAANRIHDNSDTFSLFPKFRGGPTLGEWAEANGVNLSIEQEHQKTAA